MSDVNVPMDLVVHILGRLPAKALLRFRSVSKRWCALIDSPHFIKSHLKRSLEKSRNANHKIIFRYYSLYSIDFDSLDTAVELYHPLRREVCMTTLVGSIHGLLCLYDDHKEDIRIWNPTTRMHLKLPSAELVYHGSTDFRGCGNMIYGFGYDQVHDDYKVLRVVQLTGVHFSDSKIYSMKSNSWCRISKFPYSIPYNRDYGTLANGALHWVVNRIPEAHHRCYANLIAAFDLASYEYHLVPQPEFTDNDFPMNVGVLGGCLTMQCNPYGKNFDLWVMKDYGIKNSWTKLFSIAQPYDSYRSFEFLKPIAYSKSGGQVLVQMEMSVQPPQTRGNFYTFFWYDLEKKNASKLCISGAPLVFMQCMSTLESLVQLNGSGVRDVKKPASSRWKKEEKYKNKQEVTKSTAFVSLPYASLILDVLKPSAPVSDNSKELANLSSSKTRRVTLPPPIEFAPSTSMQQAVHSSDSPLQLKADKELSVMSITSRAVHSSDSPLQLKADKELSVMSITSRDDDWKRSRILIRGIYVKAELKTTFEEILTARPNFLSGLRLKMARVKTDIVESAIFSFQIICQRTALTISSEDLAYIKDSLDDLENSGLDTAWLERGYQRANLLMNEQKASSAIAELAMLERVEMENRAAFEMARAKLEASTARRVAFQAEYDALMQELEVGKELFGGGFDLETYLGDG